MLQLASINRAALEQLGRDPGFPPRWQTMGELERSVNDWVGRLRREREQTARARGGLTRLAEWFDRKVRTDRTEHLDDPDFPAEIKLKMVRALHNFNRLFRSYPAFLRILEPLLHKISRRQKRPVRLLELACGSGEFTLALAKLVARRGLPVEITGSDYIPAYVDSGNRMARERGVPAKFRLVNAFDMQTVEPGAYDVMFIAQSLHHFSPGQLAMMIAQSCGRATSAFVGVDGYRSIPLLLVVPGPAVLTLRRAYVHDALVTARRLYPQAELELIGRLAAPDARVSVRRHGLGFSVLQVYLTE